LLRLLGEPVVSPHSCGESVEWRALPLMPLEILANMEPVLVQLVMEDDGKSYRVILVCHIKSDVPQGCSAHCYDSERGVWSAMASGLVYDGCSTLVWTVLDAPCVFDCATKVVHELIDCPALEGVNAKRGCSFKVFDGRFPRISARSFSHFMPWMF
jgi:hypothetical protein